MERVVDLIENSNKLINTQMGRDKVIRLYLLQFIDMQICSILFDVHHSYLGSQRREV